MDHYRTLGVAPTASPAEIRAAYRARSKVLHPDMGGDAAAFDRLQRAYRVLAEPAERRRYDRERAGPRASGPASAPSGHAAARAAAERDGAVRGWTAADLEPRRGGGCMGQVGSIVALFVVWAALSGFGFGLVGMSGDPSTAARTAVFAGWLLVIWALVTGLLVRRRRRSRRVSRL
ncbi:MAG: DnaJ domain-containing protein [Actinomycetota bacterium]